MRYALVNPNWTFDGSIYFGCREPHLPLELGYAKQLLEQAGHEALLVDGQLRGLSRAEISRQVADFAPDFTVVTTAPGYLFWRCAPPELRVPLQTVRDLREMGGVLVAIGPHGSTTPAATLRKLDVDVVVRGEPEELLPKLAGGRWAEIPSLCIWDRNAPRVTGAPHASDLRTLPALRWDEALVRRHLHHHHRFDAPPAGPGAELEASRGCPYQCTFCAKENYRNRYRRRPLPVLLEELDALLAAGVEYVYFIDEIFLPDRPLLEALRERPVRFGVQTRIDLWSPEMLDLLGAAGCMSIEAGVESISAEGREILEKRCRMTTDQLAGRLVHARRTVPFVQASLIESRHDDPEAVEAWRQHLLSHGVWANKPVPVFPYPGSPDYTRLWGVPDDRAWERAHAYYLSIFESFSDIQDQRPLPLAQLEQGDGL